MKIMKEKRVVEGIHKRVFEFMWCDIIFCSFVCIASLFPHAKAHAC